MKQVDFNKVVGQVSDEDIKGFLGEPNLKEEEKVGKFTKIVIRILDQKNEGNTLEDLRNWSKVADKLSEGKGICELSDEQFATLKKAWEFMAVKLNLGAGKIVAPMCDFLNELAK